jgi:hypothetical protein
MGILNNDSLYDTYGNTDLYEIFINQDTFEKYVNLNKKTETKTYYYVKDEDKPYLNEVPENKEIIQTVVMTPWTPDCYILYVDDLGYLDNVLSKINDLGLNAKSIYIDSTNLQKAIQSTQQGTKFAGIGVIVLLLCIAYGTKKKEYSEEIKTNEYFNNIGVPKQDINKMKIQKYFIRFLLQTMICIILSILFLIILNHLVLSNTSLSYILIISIFLLTFIIEFIYPIIIERKWFKHA